MYFRNYQSFGQTCCYRLQVEMSPTTHYGTLYRTPADDSLEHQYLALSKVSIRLSRSKDWG